MLALADALGWKYSIKQLSYRPTELLTSLFLGPSLTGINKRLSSALETPWPDLIITAGRRNEPVARWVRQQTGNQANIVHLGRPWAPLDTYSLIVTTPQYSLPDRKNCLSVPLPLHRVNKTTLDVWRDEWAGKLADLPRPWWVVLLGGDSGPYVFGEEKGRQLGQWVNQQASIQQGSVLVSNSARTPAKAYAAFLSQITVPVQDYHWQKNADDNPYQGYLAHADNLVVTGESMSMLAEAAATQAPLYLFDLADCPEQMPRLKKQCSPWWLLAHNYRYKPLTHRLAATFAPSRLRRDVSKIQTELVNSGRAVWVGQEFIVGQYTLQDSLKQAVYRVRLLME